MDRCFRGRLRAPAELAVEGMSIPILELRVDLIVRDCPPDGSPELATGMRQNSSC